MVYGGGTCAKMGAINLTGELIYDVHPVPKLLLDKGPQGGSRRKDFTLPTWLLFISSLWGKSRCFAHIFGEDVTF